VQQGGGVHALRALDILSSAAAVIAEGEVMQLTAAKNIETREDESRASSMSWNATPRFMP
jgi:geranylgeranyl pyrophosphate synthase